MLALLNVIALSPDLAISTDVFEKRRQEMVEKDIKGRGVKDQRVLRCNVDRSTTSFC